MQEIKATDPDIDRAQDAARKTALELAKPDVEAGRKAQLDEIYKLQIAKYWEAHARKRQLGIYRQRLHAVLHGAPGRVVVVEQEDNKEALQRNAELFGIVRDKEGDIRFLQFKEEKRALRASLVGQEEPEERPEVQQEVVEPAAGVAEPDAGVGPPRKTFDAWGME
eukprot:4774606-Heterocapsa_arctica.AAC.1